MADTKTLLSVEVEHFDRANSPYELGAGFYFTLIGTGEWRGPYETMEMVEQAVTELFEEGAKNLLKAILNLE
jgi:hypothetical protein